MSRPNKRPMFAGHSRLAIGCCEGLGRGRVGGHHAQWIHPFQKREQVIAVHVARWCGCFGGVVVRGKCDKRAGVFAESERCGRAQDGASRHVAQGLLADDAPQTCPTAGKVGIERSPHEIGGFLIHVTVCGFFHTAP